MVKAFVLGVIVTVVVLGAVVWMYFATGMAPVATSAPPMPFEKRLARMALHARVGREMPTQVPVSLNETNLTAGAQVYVEFCAVCHGVPGKDQNAIGKGEFPSPPHLFRGKGVTDDEPGETYWKVSNGIRLTGMPGFNRQLSATQMWQVSLLLANADKLPASTMAVLTNASKPYASMGADGQKSAPILRVQTE
jgi:thiosulfate dehydrogenase